MAASGTDAVYLVATALEERGIENPFGTPRLLDDPLLNIREFVRAVDDRHKFMDGVHIPFQIAELLAAQFKLFLLLTDNGLLDPKSALARAFGIRGRGQGGVATMSKAKVRGLRRAMDVAWSLHAAELDGAPISLEQATANVSAWAADEYPAERGYQRQNLFINWNRYGETALVAVRWLIDEPDNGEPLIPREDWPEFAKY